MPRPRLIPAAIALAVVLLPLPASATSSTAGDAGPNFNESPGCGSEVRGVIGPFVEGTGFLPESQLGYGPWADFFGRNRSQIEGSLVEWAVPGGGGKTVKMHSRLLPALNQVTTGLAASSTIGNDYPVTTTFGWAWRTIGGKRRLSHHFWGNAVDINPSQNPYRADDILITDMPGWWVDVWSSAGFCWGGYWVHLKDPMHLSWMGPIATAGYGPRPAPYPPLTAARPFDAQAVLATTAFQSAGDAHPGPRGYALADRSKDGSEDLYAVRLEDGELVVEASGSRSGYSIIGFRRYTGVTAALDDVVLADLDGDARADLVVLDRPGGRFTVHSDESDFEESIGTYPLSAASDAEYAFAYFDDDWSLDLISIERGPATDVKVWSSSSDYTIEVASATLAVGDTSSPAEWAFAIGDYDVDGRADVYAVERGSPAVMTVATGASGFQATTQITTGAGIGPTEFVSMGDYDGDGRDDLYVVGAGDLRAFLGGVRSSGEVLETWFLPNDPPPWDAGPECTGPFPCDQPGFIDDGGEWSLRDQFASDMDDTDFFFGNPGDYGFVGDWDCNGTATPGLYRGSDGFVYLRNSNSAGVADISYFFGNPQDVPLAGDFNGDGCDTVSLYRPDEQRFYIINHLGADDVGIGAADFSFVFGDPGDQAFVGDMDGNGVTDVALHRSTTGLVYYRTSLSTGAADDAFIYGDPGDVLFAGDWEGDGVDTVGLFRPSKGRWYIRLANSQGVADHAISYDDRGSVTPVVGWFDTAD